MNSIVDPYTLLEHPKPLPAYWALVDAFDAVTNGMDNPDALYQISNIDNGEIWNWKWLVFAIKALYEGNRDLVETAIAHIQDGSPPAVLKPIFELWLSEISNNRASSFETRELVDLYNSLRLSQHPLANRAEQVEEALKQGLLPLFEHHSEKILYELYHIDPQLGPRLAIRYGVHLLCLLHEAGYRLEDFLTLLVQAFGEADGCCCLALACLKLQRAQPNLQELTYNAIDTCLAAQPGLFADADTKKTLKLIKHRLYSQEKIGVPERSYREPVQMELF